MKALLRSIAFVYGFALMYFVGIWVTGFMAARQVSPDYFRLFASFGAAGKEASLALLGVAQHLLPTLLLLCLGVLSATYMARQDRRAVGLSAVLGCSLSYAFWQVFYSVQGSIGVWSMSTFLAPYVSAPWWAWPNILAPFLGLAFAVALLPKHAAPRAGA
jgi:hypothetical protein